jgi:hypothetical protein
MRVQKRNPWLYGLGMVLAAMALLGTRAGADVTSDRPGSVVIWPKVIADGTRDTIISLTNTSNTQAFAHCEYVNGIGFCRNSGAYCTLPTEDAAPDALPCPGGATDICDLDWVSEDFDIILTRQQPTFWRVSTGRVFDPLQGPGPACETFGDPLRQSCPGFFEAGQVIPPVQPFRGEVRCIQTSMDGNAIAANALKGEATIETLGSIQISEYNSVNIRAVSPPIDNAAILELNGVDPANTSYNVYNACPEAVEVTNYARGAEDLVAASIDPAACATSGCPVTTEFTVIPCRADFENEIATRFQLFIEYTNEFEQTLSIERAFDCWTTFTLENLGFSNVADSTFQRTRITPSGSGLCIAGDADLINTPCSTDAACGTGGDAVCAPASGILAVVEEFHGSDVSEIPSNNSFRGTDAANTYSVDANNDGFLGKRGHCRGALTTTCDQDSDCPAGKCRDTGASCGPAVACGAGDFCDQCMNDEIRFQPDVIVPVPPGP